MAKKRRGPGRPITTGKGTLVGVRCQKPLLKQLDDWRKEQAGDLSRPDALRQLAELGLQVSEQERE